MGKKQQQQKAAGGKGAAKAGKKARAANSANSSPNNVLHDPLDRQLALLGLRAKNITADGNCFFRALSDQLQGDEARHSELRAQVCGLMADQPDSFAPFVEDDQTLEGYLKRMRKEGVWAGHMELQAASLLLESNIAIYQAGQPRWCISNFPPGSRMLHLAYEGGEHYNSVRLADDYSRGTPAAIPDKLTPVADAAEVQQCWSAADERRVAEGTGCSNTVLVRQQLQAAGGDVAAAIEAVIEIMAGDDYAEQEEEDAAGSTGATKPSGAAAAAAAATVSAEAEVGPSVAAGDVPACSAGQDEEGADACPVAAVGGDAAQVAPDPQPASQPAAAAEPVSVDAGLEHKSAVQAAAAGDAAEQKAAASGTDGSSSPQQQQQAQQLTADCSNCNGLSPSNPAQQQSLEQSEAVCANTSSSSSNNNTSSGSTSRSSKQPGSSSRALKGVRLKGSNSSSSSVGVSVKQQKGGGNTNKAPSRNKPCPCGSGRKHKSCCGAAGHSKGGSKGAQGGDEGKAAAAELPAALATLHI